MLNSIKGSVWICIRVLNYSVSREALKVRGFAYNGKPFFEIINTSRLHNLDIFYRQKAKDLIKYTDFILAFNK
ncbi:hypothetical protein CKO29_00585 [Allochromatium vinosum]|nr:hypothetical protein [Allochromatium vinosum]